MMLNEKIEPIKRKSRKTTLAILAIPFVLIGYGYSLIPPKDLSDNPPHEDSVIMTKIALKNNLFNENPKEIQSINCTTNAGSERVCMISMANSKKDSDHKPHSPGTLLLLGKSVSGNDLTSTITINNKEIDLPNYNIDFANKSIELTNLYKAYYTPHEIYNAITQEEESIINELNAPPPIKNKG